MKRKRKLAHDHRSSLWVICGGLAIWCYQCGAWKSLTGVERSRWHRPTGLGGKNPWSVGMVTK